MAKYIKKPIPIEATQWFKNGDHPEDHSDGSTEGKVVKFYIPEIDGQCQYCKKILHSHGWIDTLEGGHIVCPGDWIITGIKNEKYPCKPDIFEQTYEKINERDDI